MSISRFKIRMFKQGLGLDVATFFNKYFPELIKGTQRHSFAPEYFEWKYGSNPFGEAFIYQCWLKDELIGTFGAVPRPVMIRNKIVTGYLGVDSFVAPPYQGRHLHTILADKVYAAVDRVSDICIGVGVTPKSLRIAEKKHGYRKVLDYRKYRLFIRPDLIFRAVEKPILIPFGKLMTSFFQTLYLNQKIDFKIRKITTIDDLMIPKPVDDLDFSIARNSDYLKYRYFDCPEIYQVYNLYNEQCQLVLVTKPIQFKNIRLLYLVDVIQNQVKPIDSSLIARAMYQVGRTTGAYACVMEYTVEKMSLNFFFHSGFIPSRSVGTYIIRQNRWDFLKPNNAAFDHTKWQISPGDGDNI